SPLEKKRHCRGQSFPTLQFALQLPFAVARERVELRTAAQFRVFPFGLNPPLLLQPVKCRIEGSLLYGQDIVGKIQDSFGNAPAVQRLAPQSFENQQIQRSLEKIRWFRHVLTP